MKILFREKSNYCITTKILKLMKLNVFKISFVAAMCLVLFSCSQDEIIYSCDEGADAWVKENLSDIVRMERAEWLEIGNIDYQRAAYRGYKPEQKQALWINKVNDVLSNIEWTQQERKHIENLLTVIKESPKVFENSAGQEEMDKVEIELYRWTEYAKEELKWTPELLYSLIGTPEAMNSGKQLISGKKTGIRLKNGGESTQPDCDCNSSNLSEPGSSGNWFPCVAVLHRCSTISGCNVTSWGCGNLWLYSCNGTCVSSN
ncbi:MAG: bacteriocin fulvocin C-related protein [Bacteroidales bacterium]|nr:bacteriocin fulvocin C-related protein [Bacteroidales bacterium]